MDSFTTQETIFSRSTLIQIFLISLLGIIGVIFWKTSDQNRRSQTSPIPVVTGASLIGFFFQLISNYKGCLQLFEKLFSKYGQTFCIRIFTNDIVVTSDPNIFQKLFTSTEHLEKPKLLYHRFFKNTSILNGLVVSNVETWRPHRQIISKAYTYGNLKLCAPVINIYGEKLISDLKAGRGTLPQIIHSYTLQAIQHLTTGMECGLSGSKVNFLNEIDRLMKIISTRVNPLLDLIWYFPPKREELIKLSKSVEELLIKEYILPARLGQENHNRFKTSLDLMVERGLSDGEILSELFTLILAGHETTSISINLLLFGLALNQQHQLKCRDEVDALFERMEEEKRQEILMEDTSQLKYLERCIKESLRLYPAAPAIARELQSPIKMDKFEFGKGTIVTGFLWAIHKNQEYFSNPEKFDPDRFLPENCKSRHPYAYVPFSTGPRKCIGWRLAMLEITIYSAWILRHFELFTDDCIQDINIRFRLSLETDKEVVFRLKERLHKS